jgi:hypothetical protein
MLCAITGITDTYHHALLFSIEMGALKHFLPRLAWNHISPNLSLPHSWDNKWMPLCPGISWHGVSEVFAQDGLLILASQVARSTGVNHWHLTKRLYFEVWNEYLHLFQNPIM